MAILEVVAAGIFLATQVVLYLKTRTIQAQGKELHITMNSRLDQLIIAVTDKARMEGHASGMLDERDNPQPKS